MSEKKAPENKREKEKLIHVTEEQLQAGKAEIMKIVAGPVSYTHLTLPTICSV